MKVQPGGVVREPQTPPEVRVKHNGIRITTWGYMQNVPQDTQLWYRAMPVAEYNELKKNNKFVATGYGGITDDPAYLRTNYLGKPIVQYANAPAGTTVLYSYMVEYAVIGIDLRKEFKKIRLSEKAENNATSFGLGKGQQGGIGGDAFNKLLDQGSVTWRLVGSATNP